MKMETYLQFFHGNKLKQAILLFAILLCWRPYAGYAGITVTVASASICTNYASTGSSPHWTSLSTISLKEGKGKDMGNTSGSWSVTLVVVPPTGWQFNSVVSPTLTFTALANITSLSLSGFTSTSMTIVVAGTGNTKKDLIKISGLQVQATSTTAASGNIHPSSVTGYFNGVTTTKNFGTLSRTAATAGTASVSIAASPSGTVCSGTSVAFTATPTNGGTAPTYQWKLNGTDISGATSVTYSSSSLANGNVITCALISNSCITTATATSAGITMSVNPIPNITNFSSQFVASPCLGTDANVTVNSSSLGSGSFIVNYNLTGANNGIGYSDTLAIGTSTGTFPIRSYILDTTGSTTITVSSVATLAGCPVTVTDSNVASFTVNTPPTATTASGGGTFCGSTTITATNGGSGTIYFQGTTSGGTSTATASTTQSVSTSGTYYFRARSAAGCWGTEGSVTVAINALPTTVTVSGGGTFCGSSTVTAANGSSGTIYYQGTTSGGTSVTTSSVSQSISASGTYYFRAQSSAGCWSTEGSATVTINPLPAAIGGTISVCVGSATILSNSTAGGTWSSSNTAVATIGSSGNLTGVAAGTTNITYTLSTGCIATVTATVLTAPAAIGGAVTVCSGSTTTLTNTSANGIWSSGNTAVATIGSSTGVVTGVANGVATITYSTGCGTAATKNMTVGNSPITGTLTVCVGATTALSNASAGGTWASGNTSIATVNSLSGVATGVAGGTATISFTSGSCVSTAVVTVNTSPAAIGGTASTCAGTSTPLNDATLYGSWTSANTAIATVGSTGIVTGVAAGNVTISYSTGCGTAATKTFTVNALPLTITGASAVCVSATTNLGDPSGGGTWTSGSAGIATIGSGTGIVTGVAAGTAAVTYTLSTGCLISTAITVNPLPSSITGTTAACAGANSTLSDVTGTGTWSSGNTAIASVGSGTGIVTGVAAGTTRITYTLGTGCFVSTPVTINPLPSAISGTASVCIGSATTLSDAGGGTWTSSNTSRASVGTSSGIVTGIVAGSATISYMLPTGCVITTPVTVNSLPAAISGTNTVCVSANTTLSDAGGGIWSSSNSAIATIGSSTGVVSGISSGTANVTYTLVTGCLTVAPVTVNPLPAAGTISGTTTFCEGDVNAFSDAVTGGVWSSNDTTIASIDYSGNVSGEGGGNTFIIYTYTNSCGSATATIGVTINPLPAVDTIAGASSLCTGSTTTLTNSVSGGIWSSTNTSITTIGSASGIATGVAAGTAIISYNLTNACGSDFDTATITIMSAPAAISGTASVCPGSTITLTDAGGGSWSSSSSAIATVGSGTGIVTGVAAGNATITYTVSTGCTATKVVTVNPLPAAIDGNAAVCMAATTTLSNVSGGGTWSSSNTSIATIGSGTGIVSPVAAGTATITYTLATGCKTTTVVTVNTAPTLTGASNNGPICAGVTLAFTASGAANVTGYLWAGPVAITASTTAAASVPSANTSATGTYTVTVNNGTGAGCSRGYTTAATVNASPAAAPTNNGPICTGGTVTLTANPSGGATVYAWSGASLSSATAANPTATPTITATYSLTVTNGSGRPGCSPGTVYTTTVTYNTAPTAAPTNNGPVCSAATVTLTANPGGSTNTYTWSGAALSSTTAQNPTATPTVTSTYSLTVSYGSAFPGCSPSNVYTTTVTIRAAGYWLGGTSNSWGNGANWCGGVPLTTTAVLIPAGATYFPIITSGTWPTSSITIQTGASITMNDGTLQIATTISNSGTFTATSGSIELNGSSAQTIPASTFVSNTIKNLNINNSAGATLGGTLNISGVMKATTGNLATGGFLNLLSTAVKTALIDGSGTGEVTGNVTMQRYIDTSYGYRYISSPFTAATVGGLAGAVSLTSSFPSFYSYTENVAYTGWTIDTVSSSTLAPMLGYSANFGTSFTAQTYSLTGVVSNHSISATLYNHNQAYTLGYNLVGNPYPSPIDWTASSGWTKTNIDNAIYYFNSGDTNQYYGTYSTYISGVSSDGIASNIIPAMQGFFVHVTNGSYPVTGTLTVANTARVINFTPYYHKQTSGADWPLVRIDAGYTGDHVAKDPTVVYFNDHATDAFNSNVDALKLINTDVNVPSLYSFSQDKMQLSIKAITSLKDSTNIIPLGLQTAKDGMIDFNARTIDNLPAGTKVYFYDAKTGVSQDLQVNAKYSAYLAAGKYDSRFFLLFSTKDKLALPGSAELNAYASGNSLFVYLVFGDANVVITDMAGRKIQQSAISGNGYHEISCPFATGIYIVTLYSNMGTQSKKMLLGK
jgi:uncharacterized protein YjdB